MIDDTDVEYLANYKPDNLYIQPAKSGAFISLLDEDEALLDELEVTPRIRLALSLFYVNDRQDFSSFKLTKIRKHGEGWKKDGEIKINGFQLAKLKDFIALLGSLNLQEVEKTRISIADIDLSALKSLLRTHQGVELIHQLANDPSLSEDIFALAHKKESLKDFERLLTNFEATKTHYIDKHHLKAVGEENIWQHFFECNPWIFGHGLNYVFLDKDNEKLEAATQGNSVETHGKRVDALMHTRAVISQYVLIEIKKPSDPLLREGQAYRSGCWPVSRELSDAVTQIQKTTFDFTDNKLKKIQLKDHEGRITGEEIYRIQPKSYLIIGSLTRLSGNDDKFACFHLYRTSLNNPEIITYDELFERAKCIIHTLSTNH
ncbi:MAG: DUF4263 domain-containing protein [Alphaproteobacteria bacterium]|nr:DUF4263 domain-containing protein [Alphaproteobacteria bacterium]